MGEGEDHPMIILVHQMLGNEVVEVMIV